MANFLFNDALTSIVKGEIDYLNDTIVVLLTTDAPDVDADTYISDITGEITGGGYVRKTLASKTVTTDDTNNRTIADAADVQWTALTNAFRYIVVAQSTGVDSTSRLITAIDTGSTQTLDNGTYDITWPVSGVFNISNIV
jgi:hypothetical protein